jgi:hypothetical protein
MAEAQSGPSVQPLTVEYDPVTGEPILGSGAKSGDSGLWPSPAPSRLSQRPQEEAP